MPTDSSASTHVHNPMTTSTAATVNPSGDTEAARAQWNHRPAKLDDDKSLAAAGSLANPARNFEGLSPGLNLESAFALVFVNKAKRTRGFEKRNRQRIRFEVLLDLVTHLETERNGKPRSDVNRRLRKNELNGHLFAVLHRYYPETNAPAFGSLASLGDLEGSDEIISRSGGKKTVFVNEANLSLV